MGTGPGASQDGQFAADVEIRFALGRGDSGVYTYCVFEHKPDYPATSLGEARFCAKLADMFDWMSIAPTRNKHYPKELREGDKYVYTVVQSENPSSVKAISGRTGISSTYHTTRTRTPNPAASPASRRPAARRRLR